MIHTEQGAVASTRIEDALYGYTGVALCIAAGRAPATASRSRSPRSSCTPAPRSISTRCRPRCATLPEYARPHRVRVVEKLPMTDGFRAIKHGLRDLDAIGGPNVYHWDPRTQRYLAPISNRERGAS